MLGHFKGWVSNYGERPTKPYVVGGGCKLSFTPGGGDRKSFSHAKGGHKKFRGIINA